MSPEGTLRIAYVTDAMAVGGVETNLMLLSEHLGRRGHTVTIVSSGGALEPELEQKGLRHVRLPISLRRPLGLLRSVMAFTALISRERVDIVHSMSAAGNLIAAAVPRGHRENVRFVSSPMGLQNSDRELGVVTALRNRLLTLRVDRVLLISEEIGRAVRFLGLPPERLRERAVVGVDIAQLSSRPEASQAIREEFGISSSAFLVTTIGALHQRKRHDLFLEAARTVRDAQPSARFIVVGDGPERQHLETRRAELGLTDAVTFTGRRRDVRDIIGASDVYVKPGIVEGFIGITVLEAQAARKPVVAFDTHDVRAAIADRETGLLATIGNPSALASAILELQGDLVLSARVADGGRQRVEKRFAMDAVAAGLEAEYLDLLSQPRR